MKYTLLILGITLVLLSCSDRAIPQHWYKIYENDADGNALNGDKTELINLLKDGAELRVGFGRHERTWHLTDAAFITILDDMEVYAQIEGIVGQKPIRTDKGTEIEFVTENRWQRIIGTNGYATNYMKVQGQDNVEHNLNKRQVSAKWYIRK